MNIYRHFLFLGLVLSAIPAAADPSLMGLLGVPENAEKGTPVRIETKGFYIRTFDGIPFLLTADGRLAFRVESAVNMWEEKLIPVSEIPNINRIRFDQMDLGEVSFDQLVIGSGKNIVHGIIDPLCAYCKELIKQARDITNKGADFTFKFIVIPIAGAESDDAASKLSCMTGEKLYWALLDQDFLSLPEVDESRPCSIQQKKSAIVIRTAVDIKATPVMFAPNGERINGLPRNLKATLEANL